MINVLLAHRSNFYFVVEKRGAIFIKIDFEAQDQSKMLGIQANEYCGSRHKVRTIYLQSQLMKFMLRSRKLK